MYRVTPFRKCEGFQLPDSLFVELTSEKSSSLSRKRVAGICWDLWRHPNLSLDESCPTLGSENKPPKTTINYHHYPTWIPCLAATAHLSSSSVPHAFRFPQRVHPRSPKSSRNLPIHSSSELSLGAHGAYLSKQIFTILTRFSCIQINSYKNVYYVMLYSCII